MISRRRRWLGSALSLAVMVTAAIAVKPGDLPEQTFRVVLGVKDTIPADWSGKIAVTGGEVTALTGWRFEDKDAVEGTSSWKCRTRSLIAPGERYPLQPAVGKAKDVAETPWPNGVTITVRGAAPALTLTLPAGPIQFAAADISLGEPKSFLGGRVRVERVPATVLLRSAAPAKAENAVQDDYPAFWVRYKTGKHYLAWVAYQKEKTRVLLVERDGPDGAWSESLEIAGPGDHFRVALASLHDDTLWIVWSSQREKAWILHARPYKNGKLGDEVQLTEGAGPNFWHRMTTDNKGRAWLAWQGFKDGQMDIFARCADTEGWHETIKVSEGKGNSWDPAIAADTKEDRVWVGWDSYETSNYGIRVRSLVGGATPKPGAVLRPTESRRFAAHVSLACDRAGRLWAAWDDAGEQWGKDTGDLYSRTGANRIYQSRQVRIRCLLNGQWLAPDADLAGVLQPAMRDFHELPQLQTDGEGRMWLAFRYRTARRPRVDGWAAQGRWDVVATAYMGDRWLPPIELPHSIGRNDMRLSSQRDTKGSAYFAYASDNRLPIGGVPRNHHVAVSRLTNAAQPVEARFKEVPAGEPGLAPAPVHPREKDQVARIRSYKIDHGGRSYRIYRGDLHRHTDISTDGVGDGSLMDLHRYGIDAAALDFILVGDHNMGNDIEYNWWRTQQANDLYTLPDTFISMYGYERSVPYPNGHRNIIWAERGHRTLPLPQVAIPKQMAEDTGRLYEYLRRTNGICTLHTSATGQGTNWERAIDPALEPFVELFQGFAASYEAPGAPRIVDAKSDVIHTSFKADGYVSSALEKGYRLGFQASSDHVSTHVSYACILAEEFSRKDLIDAMKKRHAYAATDNIVLDVRMGGLGIMGDEVKTAQPGLDVIVLGTGPIDRVDVIRNGSVVHTEKPGAKADEVRFHWDDKEPVKGDKASYYYVRVVQKDGQMAWASPIWVEVGK